MAAITTTTTSWSQFFLTPNELVDELNDALDGLAELLYEEEIVSSEYTDSSATETYSNGGVATATGYNIGTSYPTFYTLGYSDPRNNYIRMAGNFSVNANTGDFTGSLSSLESRLFGVEVGGSGSFSLQSGGFGSSTLTQARLVVAGWTFVYSGSFSFSNYSASGTFTSMQVTSPQGEMFAITNANLSAPFLNSIEGRGMGFFLSSGFLSGNDVITAASKNDTINGYAGNDSLTGGAGNDYLDGGQGNDTLIGGTGDDSYIVDSDQDVIFEYAGGGMDLVQSSITFTLNNSGRLELENLSLTGAVKIHGTGNERSNQISGNSGNNALFGLGGNDQLNGGSGNDTLRGGYGNDSLTGGLGADRFKFGLPGEGVDTITDFTRSQGDKLIFTSPNFSRLPIGVLAIGRFRANTTGLAGDADDRFVFETDTRILRYDQDGNGPLAAVPIAHLNSANLWAMDIQIVAS